MPGKKKKNNNLQQKLKNFFSKQKGQMAKIAKASKRRDDQLKRIMKQK